MTVLDRSLVTDVPSLVVPTPTPFAPVTRGLAARRRARRRSRRSRRSGSVERLLIWVLSFALFAIVGWRLAVTTGVLPGDALARTANASAALFSRDPHLESIGFVWPPFPSLWQVLFLPLATWFPVLLTHGYAGVLVSAALMATMISTLSAWFVDLGVPPWARRTLLVLCAVHPFVLAYGANGMSEAGMLCFLVIAARRLALWFERRRSLDLATASVAMGFAYLTRYEVAGAIAFVLAILVVDSLLSHRGRGHLKKRIALDLVVGGGPATFAVVLWAFVSWAVVDEPFAQFSSKYGNSLAAGSILNRSLGSASQLQVAKSGIAGAAGSLSGLPRVGFFAEQVLVLGGAAALVFLLVYSWWGTRSGPRVLAALALFGGPLAFQLASSVRGATFAWGRFAIAAVPLGVLLAGPAVCAFDGKRLRRLASAGAVVVLAVSVGSAYSMVRASALQTTDERSQLSAVPGLMGSDPAGGSSSMIVAGHTVARDLARLHLGRGQVLTDSASTFPVILNSSDQRIFVIPADRDFERTLSDPAAFGVRYLLVPDPHAAGYDSLNDSRATLFENGAGIAHLVKDWQLGSGFPHLRLYELDERIHR